MLYQTNVDFKKLYVEYVFTSIIRVILKKVHPLLFIFKMFYHVNMKLLIASDIHGSEKAALELEKKYLSLNPDLLILLGDLLYHGPRNDLPESYNPKKVIEILSRMKDRIIAVRGNCEAEVDQMVLPFSCLSESAIVFADGKRIFLTHGHIWSMDKHPEGIDVFMQGHTHLPVLKEENEIIYLNPGSTSIPKGGNPPSYALWQDGKIEILELYSDTPIASLERSR